MSNRKSLEKDIELVGSFKGLAEAYEEISVSKMQKIRGKVLSSREFLDDLSQVFSDVKVNYHEEIEKMLKNKKGSSILSFKTYQKNNKTISILLSSNSKLYGDIGRKVFQYFIKSIKDKNTDIYIVGRVGKEFFDATGIKTTYKYVDFPEGKDEKENLNKILPILTEYENVNIFYGQYINVLTQNPTLSDVLGEEEIEENQKKDDKTHFFFEPSLEKVYKLFQDEISGSIFRQTVHESELSHVASRITQMESALGNISSSQKNLNSEKRRLTKREEGKKQLERLAGMKVWK